MACPEGFLLSLGATLSVLLIAAEFAVPGWFAEWLATLAAYAHYAGGSPLLADLLQGHCLLPATALLLGAAVWVSFKFQGSDLLFAISFSAAAFALIFPFQLYNAVLLFPAVLWLIANSNLVMAHGQLLTLLYSCTWIVLGAGWASATALSLSNLLVPGSGLMFWQVPFAAAYLYPYTVAACLGVYAASRRLPAPRPKAR